LDRGRIGFDGPTERALAVYASYAAPTVSDRNWGNGTDCTLLAADLIDPDGNPTVSYSPGTRLRFAIEFKTTGVPGQSLEILLRDERGAAIGFLSTGHFHKVSLPSRDGRYSCVIELQPMWLAAGRYSIDVISAHLNIDWDHHVERAVEFQVPQCAPNGGMFDLRQSLGHGALALLLSSPIVFKRITAD
jgi:Wzt-like putative exopolysaccharide export protein